MRKLLVLGLSLVGLFTACDPFYGQLNILAPVTVKLGTASQSECLPDDLMCEWGAPTVKQITLQRGAYNADIDLISSREAVLHVTVGGRKQSISIKLKNNAIPSYSGPVSLKSSEIGQPFDIVGQVNSKVTESAPEDRTESCVYQHGETHCRYVKNPQTGVVEKKCKTAPDIMGTREVTFHHRYTDTKMNLNLQQPMGGQIGSFAGNKTASETVYDHIGTCYRDSYYPPHSHY